MWETIGAIFGALIGAGAAVGIGLHSTRITIANQYRPVLRPEPSPNPGEIVIENVGNGAALGVVLFTKYGSKPIAELAELPAPAHAPHPKGLSPQRTGWVVDIERFDANDRTPPLEVGRTYRVLYQDIVNSWHETEFAVISSNVYEVRFLGPVPKTRGRLPAIARDYGLRVAIRP